MVNLTSIDVIETGKNETINRFIYYIEKYRDCSP